MRKVYLDHSSTTPLDHEVLEVMRPYFAGMFGNASSIHQFGQTARAALDESREKIARMLGAQSGEIIFVSGGTEADNFAIKGAMWKSRDSSGKNHIVTSTAEHHAVLETCRFLEEHGFDVTYTDVDQYGRTTPDRVRDAITPRTGLISIMHVNNEIGTINPIKEIGRVAKEQGILFHTDAVQGFGKVSVDVNEFGVDLLSISAHKLYGPKGIGALYVRKGVAIDNLIHGGSQERGRRAGTENVPLAVGFAEAAMRMNDSQPAEWIRLRKLREAFRRKIEAAFPFVLFNGHPSDALPHILNISFDSSRIALDGETLLFTLDLHGIAVTSGSACTSGSMDPSHVLLSLGRDAATAKASIRFSMGKSTTLEDIEHTVETLKNVVQKIADATVKTG